MKRMLKNVCYGFLAVALVLSLRNFAQAAGEKHAEDIVSLFRETNTHDSPVKILVIPTNEELRIARETEMIIKTSSSGVVP